MIQQFNYFGTHENPNIWLCNPNKSRVGVLVEYMDSDIKLRFNEMSELSLTVPYPVDNDLLICYNKIEQKRLLEVDNVGYFLINNVSKNTDGIKETKTITAYSLECELQYKKVVLLSGTYKFYDLANPEKTLLGLIFDGSTNWEIGQVDSELLNSYRTFDVPDSTVYSFLINDVEQAYECLFTFNSITRKVDAHYLPNYLKKTDIYLSFDNLLENTEVTEESEEICTSLKVYGSDINIRGVNPTGSDAIYDFSYYMTTEWMPQTLINALTTWMNKCSSQEAKYKSLLLQIKTNNTTKVTKQSELVELESEYDKYEGVMAVRVRAGRDYSDIKQQMDAVMVKIVAKRNEIDAIDNILKDLNAQVSVITQDLLLENNITEDLWTELVPFIIQNTYQNETFIVTTIMTEAEKQTQQEELLAMGQNVLQRVAHPRYTFSLDSNNFIYMKEFSPFTNQLELGAVLNINTGHEVVKPILLEVEYSFTDPTLLTLTFGNRYRLDSAEYEFSDLFGDAISGGTSVKFDSAKWGEYVNSGMNNEVSEFINGSLDAAKNNVINASNQEIKLNQNGLRGRTAIGDGVYQPEQCWLTADTLAFTDDNWNQAKTALGKLSINGQTYYGLSAEVVIGRLVAGNQLIIQNDNNTFTVDGSGATMNNGSITITKGINKIVLNPQDGITVYKNNDKQLYLNPSTGDLEIAGKITAQSGSIGGWTINNGGLSNSVGDYINSTGYGKLSLFSWTPNSATFNGDIYANKIHGSWADWSSLNNKIVQMDTVIANKATIGDLNATNAQINSLWADKASVGQLNAANARIDTLNANTVKVGTITADSIKLTGGQMTTVKAYWGVQNDAAYSFYAPSDYPSPYVTVNGRKYYVQGFAWSRMYSYKARLLGPNTYKCIGYEQ